MAINEPEDPVKIRTSYKRILSKENKNNVKGEPVYLKKKINIC